MKLTTKQLKQIIKEELDLLQLPLEWVSIKKEWESLKQLKLPDDIKLKEGELWGKINRPKGIYLEVSPKDKEQTIKKYPQYFPPKKSRGWVSHRQASMQVQAHGYPAKNEEGEWGYWDDTKEKPFEWTEEGVVNIWLRDKMRVIENHIKAFERFYSEKIRPFQKALVHQIREQMKYGFDNREGEDLMRIVNDFAKTKPPLFNWFGNYRYQNLTLYDFKLSQYSTNTWDRETRILHKIPIKHLQKQLRQLEFNFNESIDLISRWKKRIDNG